MSETYKVEVDGKTIEYGAYTNHSHFSDVEWEAIYHKMVKENHPGVYEIKKNDDDFIMTAGSLIGIEERYEALLELLPQSSFSKAGTHPQWVADAVEENTLDKLITQNDVKDMIKDVDDVEELKECLVNYFEIMKLVGRGA
ncbi:MULTISPECIES: hypothetical protein [Carnobacterium]|uniref:Phage protein n=1 Tax=Carnobacterium antarcticum TaxID=2126436 RepID=A0ABW4NMI8_9LACT|nr:MULTISPECIES: hypothetical protein [unclassified Carnobacterium]ALV21037.1 Phage protein [Carnobacterium sp. CP1]QQP71188.1 hypothetical protein JHE06_05305 [Carnobacterium sp. CS13]